MSIKIKGLTVPTYCDECLFRKVLDNGTEECIITASQRRAQWTELMPFKFRDCPIEEVSEMTEEELIKEIEESIQDIEKCISEDEEYIRGWKCAMLTVLEKIRKVR